jgi:4-hydroxymandelate oxidase
MVSPREDLESRAGSLLPAPVFEYFRQGSADEVSVREAVRAWRHYRFLPHVLRDVSTVSVSTELLGTAVATPVAVAPTALQRHAHPAGEQEMAAGVAAAGSLICVSGNAGVSYADVASAGAPWWAQLYVVHDRAVSVTLLRRAVAAGASAVVLTADTPVVAAKRIAGESAWDISPAGFAHANEDRSGASPEALGKALDLSEEAIAWVHEVTGLPVVVKGILRADDAVRVVDAGAAAVWVSNHGGRQLDRSVATAHALRPVAQAVGDRAQVYVDGGVRDGHDVLTALALGAHAVFLGRPPLWALTSGGAQAVRALVDGITAELVEAMVLAGCRTWAELRPDLLCVADPWRPVE